MIRFPITPRKRTVLEITPLVDVVFLLLVFFLLTSTFMMRGLDLDLPQAGSAQEIHRQTVVVSLAPNDDLRLNGKRVPADRLERLLREAFTAEGRPSLTIEADRSIAFSRFAQVLDVARLAGAAEVNLATDLTDPPGSRQ